MQFEPNIIEAPNIGTRRELETYLATIVADSFQEEPEIVPPDNEEMDEEDRFEFDMIIVTKALVPDRYCYFGDTSKKNFGMQAEEGVSLQQCHSYRDLGLGYTFKGMFNEAEGDVQASAYIPRDWDLAGDYSYPRTNIYIEAIEKYRTVRDVSVGISGGYSICSICGGNIWSYRECIHWPGVEYEVGEEREKKLCTYTIYDANLCEVSLVPDGAVPGAMILKAQEMTFNKEISIDDVSKIFQKRYRCVDIAQEVFHNKVYAYPSVPFHSGSAPESAPESASESASEKEEEVETQPLEGQMDFTTVRTALLTKHPDLTIPEDAAEAAQFFAEQYATQHSLAEAARNQVSTLTEQVTQLNGQITKLTAQAADGEAYRKDWYDKAKESYTKRFGGTLPEVYVTLFENPATPAAVIRQWAETWQSEFEGATDSEGNKLHAGGQKTQDGNGEETAVRVIMPPARG